MKKIAIIVAGGSGLRAGGSIPKQLQGLGDKPVFAWSVRAFLEEYPGTHIIIAVNAAYKDMFESHIQNMRSAFPTLNCQIAVGGKTRAESVMNALSCTDTEGDTLIAVHDAARPLVSVPLIHRGWEAARLHGAAVPVVPLSDSIRHIKSDGTSESVARSEYVAVQTPQVFQASLLKKAYAPLKSGLIDPTSVTDDASVAELAGIAVSLFEGDPINFKITGPQDLTIANTLI